jgi:hypothetical protein
MAAGPRRRVAHRLQFAGSQRCAPPHSISRPRAPSGAAPSTAADSRHSGARPANAGWSARAQNSCFRAPAQKLAAARPSASAQRAGPPRPPRARPTGAPAARPSCQHGGRNRQRLAAPFVEPAIASVLGPARSAAWPFGDRLRQHLERHLGEHAERAHRCRPAGARRRSRRRSSSPGRRNQHLAGAVEQLHAEHEVAHRPGCCRARPGQAGGDAAAHRRARRNAAARRPASGPFQPAPPRARRAACRARAVTTSSVGS